MGLEWREESPNEVGWWCFIEKYLDGSHRQMQWRYIQDANHEWGSSTSIQRWWCGPFKLPPTDDLGRR